MESLNDLSSVISDVCSTLESISSTLGSLLPLIMEMHPTAGLIIAAIPLICKILELLAPDVFEPGEIENGELAVKAEVCQDIKPEDYETFSEYIKAIHEEIGKDPEKKAQVDERMAARTEEEATAYKLVSVALAGKIVAEKLDTNYVDPALLGKLNACGFDADKTVNFIREIQKQGLGAADANKYFNGDLRGGDFEKAGEAVKAALGKIDPSLKTDEQKTEAENQMFKDIDAAVKAEA